MLWYELHSGVQIALDLKTQHSYPWSNSNICIQPDNCTSVCFRGAIASIVPSYFKRGFFKPLLTQILGVKTVENFQFPFGAVKDEGASLPSSQQQTAQLYEFC